MKVYSYSDNGFFLGEYILTDADLSPLENGVYLIPANCTQIPPKEQIDGYYLAWNGNDWGYVEIKTPEQEPQPEPTPTIPQSITPLQAKLQLLEMELLDEVEAMVATDRKISLYWNEALEIRRDHATLLAMVGALGLTDAQVDEMFIEASKLS